MNTLLARSFSSLSSICLACVILGNGGRENCDGLEFPALALQIEVVAAGPKLRKWYGEGERQPQDGGPDPDEEGEPEGGGDSILVTDGDSPTGELLLLQLMLARSDFPVNIPFTV